MTRPLLSLCLPVKNEAQSIRSVLETIRPHIDSYLILDTGSVDGTQEIVREVMSGVPGKLVEEPMPGCDTLGLSDFPDFAAIRNRVRVLDAQINNAEFQLVYSGDEYQHAGEKLRELLEERRVPEEGQPRVDLFWQRVEVEGDAAVPSPRIIRTGSAWHFRDEVHEFPTHPDADAPNEILVGPHIEHVVADPSARVANIWEKHVPVLKAMLERDPSYARALVFLAQSYDATVLHPFSQFSPGEKMTYCMEAMSYLMRRRAIDGATPAEKLYVETHFLDFAQAAGVYNHEELFERSLRLYEEMPYPETALLRAQIASQVKGIPGARIYELACAAIDHAMRPRDASLSAPYSLACAWKAHSIAAIVVHQMAKVFPDKVLSDGNTYQSLVRKHVEEGIAAGGPTWLFERFLPKVPVEGEAQS